MSFSKFFSYQILTGVRGLRKVTVGTAIVILFMAGCSGIEVCPAAGIEQLYRISNGVFDNHTEYHKITIPSGGEVELANLKGPGKITYFYITDDSSGQFYKGLVLKIFWDDQKHPSINVPLSDFFGAVGGKTIDYESVPMQINHFCYMCYLPMPFSKRARIVLANDGEREYSKNVAYGIDYEKDQAYASIKSRLHCRWQRSNPTLKSVHTLLDINGRGHYVGGFLHVFSKYKSWWGEGDTIFYVDGKKMTHTPGTEDEYGACWAFGKTYSYMYSGYIQMENGHNQMYRWYMTNPVRFQETLKVEIQNQRWEKGQTPSRDDYISVAFWYQDDCKEAIELAGYGERTAPSKAIDY